jgi:hypothetical protein
MAENLGHAAAAIALAERGFAVFPLRRNAKTPAVRKDWEGTATDLPRRIRELWRDPMMNIGIACGPSDLLVIDLDTPKGDDLAQQTGEETLRRLAAGRELPRTLTVTTPSGGRHLYFRPPDWLTLRNTAGRLGPLIDTRGTGGYVVGPGSTIDGKSYLITDDAPIAALPSWLLGELERPTAPAASAAPAANSSTTATAPTATTATVNPTRANPAWETPPVSALRQPNAYAAAALRAETQRVTTAREGTRNDTLNKAAFALGQLVGTGLLDRDDAVSELRLASRVAGLPDREAAATITSGLDAGTSRPRLVPPARPRSAPTVVTAPATPTAPVTENEPARRPVESPKPAGPADSTDWNHIFANLDPLRDAARALYRELAAVDTETDDTRPSVSRATTSAAPTPDLVATLRGVDAAYDAAALSAAPLLYTPEWRRIRAVTDALRDLRDELENGTVDYSQEMHKDVRLHDAVHALAARACHTISLLAFEISRRLSLYGLRNSPVWRGLWHLHKTSDSAAVNTANETASPQQWPRPARRTPRRTAAPTSTRRVDQVAANISATE